MLTPDQIRSMYLRFFEERDHRVVASSPVVPQGDHAGRQLGAVLAQIMLANLGPDAKAVIPVAAAIALDQRRRASQVAQPLVPKGAQKVVVGGMGKGGMTFRHDHVQQSYCLLNTLLFNNRQVC